MKKKYKVLFIDLDGTLITTATGKTFPEGVWDMLLRFDTLEAIKNLSPEYVCIVTNQGGIEKGHINENAFGEKLSYVSFCVDEYCNTTCNMYFCASNDKSHKDRKPNIGMLERAVSDMGYYKKCYEKSEILMVGDASGKPGDFSDSDKKTAENFGVDYLDVEEFNKIYRNMEDKNDIR